MVEGPEATHLASKLKKHFANKRLQHIKIKDGRYKHHGPPDNYRAFVRQLPLRLLDVGNKGKVLFFLFESGWVLIAKLGMVGWFYEPGDKLWFDPQPNIEFEFSGSGSGTTTTKSLFFADFRNFGTLTFTQDMMEVLREYNAIASDILAPSTTYRALAATIQTLQAEKPQMTIDTLLMDQTLLISGIGNIIKSELLYDARISPHRRVSSLTPANWQAIVAAARRFSKRTLAVLEDADANADADFSKYAAIRRVYGRKEDPYKNKVHTYKSADGRTTFWVPSLQL